MVRLESLREGMGRIEGRLLLPTGRSIAATHPEHRHNGRPHPRHTPSEGRRCGRWQVSWLAGLDQALGLPGP